MPPATAAAGPEKACPVAVSPSGLEVPAAGVTACSFSVAAAAGCAYTAVSNAAYVVITAGASGAGNGNVVFNVAPNVGPVRKAAIAIGGRIYTVAQAAGVPVVKHTPFDFDGDGRADISIYRPSTGTWFVQNSSTGFESTQFGFSTDKIEPGDYDGDGKTQIAIYRPSNGTWYILNPNGSYTSTQFGISTDLPIPAFRR